MITRRGLLKIAPGALAARSWSRPGTPAWQEALDDIAATTAIGVLAEVHGSAGRWAGSGGVTRLGGRQPVPAGARGRAGSITKSFVATVVLQLAGEGRLALDDTVRRWLPEAADGITVRHLGDRGRRPPPDRGDHSVGRRQPEGPDPRVARDRVRKLTYRV